MRICFELLDLLKAHKKGIRRAAVNSFGYIAKASCIVVQLVLCLHLSRLLVLKTFCPSCSPICVYKSARVVYAALLPSQLLLKLVDVSDSEFENMVKY